MEKITICTQDVNSSRDEDVRKVFSIRAPKVRPLDERGQQAKRQGRYITADSMNTI